MPITLRWAYFDHAAVAPLSAPAQTRMVAFADEAAHTATTLWPQWSKGVESFRSGVARWIGASPAEIAMIPNTSHGVNLVAEGFPWKSGDNVVTFAGEFPSNRLPWDNQQSKGVEVRSIECPGGEVCLDQIAAQIDSRTRIVAISWVGYASGYRVDLDQLAELVHSRGALLFVDAIQGMGIYPIDVSRTPIDFLAADGHKWMLGPEGAGFAYIRREHIDTLRCTHVGWHSVRNAADFGNARLDLRPEASRFEAGSANMVGLLSLAESAAMFWKVIEVHGPEAIAQRVLRTAETLIDRLQKAGATVLNPWQEPHRSSIVVFDVPGVSPAEVRGIGLQHDVVLSCRGGGVRASVHVYNNDEDLDRLIHVVEMALAAGGSTGKIV
ncbi:putative cysteine desulfurase [Rosistilla carotiformis]|uniref:Putative cysteine desulfurase n=1 Tax=Rosistilla carotiformis TaxID=2528017 RepID=A0A518JW20_9BACT|nr:aminotransferase class V-fold PLP-dependent enzyme [Rosistilla carotiformis]QDV69734.1 putative cysteine desulfurase [Rosistilla carotiformis]